MSSVEEQAARAQLTASADGRITIPAPVRHAAGIKPGQQLVAYIDDGRVVLEEWKHLLSRVQDRVTASTSDHSDSAVNELIAERRAEAVREDSSYNATLSDTTISGAGVDDTERS